METKIKIVDEYPGTFSAVFEAGLDVRTWEKENPECHIICRIGGLSSKIQEKGYLIARYPNIAERNKAAEQSLRNRIDLKSQYSRSSNERRQLPKMPREMLESIKRERVRYLRDGPLPEGIKPGSPQAEAYERECLEKKEII